MFYCFVFVVSYFLFSSLCSYTSDVCTTPADPPPSLQYLNVPFSRLSNLNQISIMRLCGQAEKTDQLSDCVYWLMRIDRMCSFLGRSLESV